ncbi:MAG: hypothetical protein JNL30_06930 [Rubrivivax sp.]|nr:hypothetical protein [Rubrivivax sp.]
MPGAQQLLAGHMLSNVKDRDHLALFMVGLFEGKAVQADFQGGRPVMKTQSGLSIELQDDAAENQGARGTSLAVAKQWALACSRSSSGIKISFDDDA